MQIISRNTDFLGFQGLSAEPCLEEGLDVRTSWSRGRSWRRRRRRSRGRRRGDTREKVVKCFVVIISLQSSLSRRLVVHNRVTKCKCVSASGNVQMCKWKGKGGGKEI